MDGDPRIRRCRLGSLALAALLALTSNALAQTGQVAGVVFDDRSQPLRGATIRAENDNAFPKSLTGTSDQKGRFSFIGLRTGVWTFTVESPGFLPRDFSLTIRSGASRRPLGVQLERDTSLVIGGPLAGVNMRPLREDLAAADEAFTAGDMDAAIALYSAVLERAPGLTLVRLQIGNAYRRKQDDPKAIEAFEAVLKTDPGNGTALCRLGEIKSDEGQLDAARDLYRKAAAAEPEWTTPLLRLGSMALEQGDMEGADSLLKKVLALDPQSPDAMAAESLLSRVSR
jgi:Carboxypeptidase regulatory-like domain/Tetratricopeptide repeat